MKMKNLNSGYELIEAETWKLGVQIPEHSDMSICHWTLTRRVNARHLLCVLLFLSVLGDACLCLLQVADEIFGVSLPAQRP